MVRFVCSVIFAMMTSFVVAAPFQATVMQDVEVRDGALDSDPVVATIKAGETVTIRDCLADLCLLDLPEIELRNAPWADANAFVVGAVPASEYAVKSRLSLRSGTTALPSKIEVWGDSLSTNTFGAELSKILGRQVQMFGVPGEDGASIASRMRSQPADPFALNILWDRHYTAQSVDSYLSDFSEMVALAGQKFIVISDIPQMENAADSALTGQINAELRTLYPEQFLDVTGILSQANTRTDGLHLTDEANDAVANEIARFVRERGF